MNFRPIILFFVTVGFQVQAPAQEIASLELIVGEQTRISAVPVSTELNSITYVADSLLTLVESVNGEEVPVNFQIAHQNGRKLIWMVAPERTGKLTYKLFQRKSLPVASVIEARIEDGGILLSNADKPLLRYNYATLYPPAGVSEVFRRSGFIHPFWSPAGKELSRIQAPDHYHHYGLWNPWTRVLYKRDTVDFWNLGEKQGTVRFANFISRISGPVYGAYSVLQEHVVFHEEGEEVVLNEVQQVRIFQMENHKESYIADISIHLNCATDEEVILQEYRYGGLGWRATEKWNRNNSETITSEGKNRKEADGSLARWCIVQGEIDDGYASVLMMSFPTNYNHPEPLRIWPEDINGRGDVFVNFSPTKNKDWKLQPGTNYQLNYRLYVSDKKISAEEAEQLWNYYSHPPAVKFTVDL